MHNRKAMKKGTLAFIAAASCLLIFVAPYFILDCETKLLDDQVRNALSGSFLRLPDGVVHYEMKGPPSAQVVVLVHGFSVPFYVWDPTFAALSDAGFRVLRYDLYGRGYSDRPKKDYTIGLFVSQLHDLLHEIGITQPVDLIGLSLGAPVIAGFFSQYVEQVHSLVFIDPAVSNTTTARTFPMNVPVIGEYIMAVVLGPFLLPRMQANDFFRPERFPDWQARYRDQMQYRGFKRALLSTIRNTPHMNALPWYEQIGKGQLPVLLLWGEADQSVPSSEIDLMQKLIPRIEPHAIKEAGHLPHYEQPNVVNPILIQFLKNQVQEEEARWTKPR